jgi:hypothetical protein
MASPLVIDPSGVYFRREGAAGQFICGMSPPEAEDLDCDADHDPLEPDEALFHDTIWPILAERVPAFNNLKLRHAWAGFYDFNTFDQVHDDDDVGSGGDRLFRMRFWAFTRTGQICTASMVLVDMDCSSPPRQAELLLSSFWMVAIPHWIYRALALIAFETKHRFSKRILFNRSSYM